MRRFLILMLCLISIKMQSQQWTIAYPMEEGAFLRGGCCDGDGNYIFGVCDRNSIGEYSDAYAMYVDRNGNYITRKYCYDYKSELCSAVCLDNGNAFVVGIKGGTLMDHVYDSLWIVVMTPELEIVEEHSYPFVAPYKTWTNDIYLDFDSAGDVVILADVSDRDYPWMTNGVYVVLKSDLDGNVIACRYFASGHGPSGARPTGIVRVPNQDKMMLLGRAFDVTGVHTIAYIDNDLNLIATYPIPWMERIWNYSNYWKDDNHFLMASQTSYYNVDDSYYAAVFEVDESGHYVDTLVYDRADTSDYTAEFGSMAYFNDETIYITTYWENGLNDDPNDVVVMLIDKDLNLLGLKKLSYDGMKMRPLHCQITADGGCLVYGRCKKKYGNEMIFVCKLLPEDFVIPWTLTEWPEVSQHLNVYPDPVTDFLNFQFQCIDSHSIVVSVSDLNGRKYFKRRFDNCEGLLTIDVSTLDKGIYVYEVVKDGKYTLSGSFIKN